ncbi:MAG: hypothetical protein AAB339_08865, partial [Elusimicrobiota bacterium]
MTFQMAISPEPPLTLGFGNGVNRQVAGKVFDVGGVSLRSFQAQVQDRFHNPAVALVPMSIALSTLARSGAGVGDSFAFSASSLIAPGFPPMFAAPTTQVSLQALEFETTFFYLDTMASSSYPPSSSTRPVIGLIDLTPASILVSSAQAVVIVPDNISRIAVPPLTNAVLLAGATSEAVFFQVQDQFGNPSELKVGQEDAGTNFVQFRLRSTSSGRTQFSSPDQGAFVESTGTARVPLGSSSTSFYIIDTLVTSVTSNLIVESPKNARWTVALGSYTVRSGPPVSSRFTTPTRYLIAGTTVQYSSTTLQPMATPVDVELLDEFGNATSSTWAFHTVLVKSQNSVTTRAGQDPTKFVRDSADWKPVGPGYPAMAITIDINSSRARFFAWDTAVGTTTLEAEIVRQDGFKLDADLAAPGIQNATQNQIVTPGPADYITLYHPFTPSNPLRVNTPGFIARTVGTQALGVTLRDKFGNIAAGHPTNGRYFDGLVVF